MEPYADIGGNSGIIAYQIGQDSIIVKFREGQWTLYTYTYSSAGSSAIETMKRLAQQGHGLNSYIATYKPGYSSRA